MEKMALLFYVAFSSLPEWYMTQLPSILTWHFSLLRFVSLILLPMLYTQHTLTK